MSFFFFFFCVALSETGTDVLRLLYDWAVICLWSETNGSWYVARARVAAVFVLFPYLGSFHLPLLAASLGGGFW